MAELQVLNGPLQWKTFKVAGPRFLMGRKDTCHLVLKDGWVSREHTVLIESGPGEFTVQDLDSENGIFVNGQRVTDAPLRHDDILRVGRTEMRFFNPPAGDAATDEDRRERTVPELPADGEAAPADLVAEAAPIPEGGFDMTMHERGGRAPRSDMRDRVRRLERLLLEKEEDNAQLAAENAVLKRALAQGGLIDPRTGQVDLARLTTPSPREVVPRWILPLVSNPLAQLRWPGPGGSVRVAPAEDGAGDLASGVFRLGVVGVGPAGARIAESFHRAGWRRAAAIADASLLEELALPSSNGLETPSVATSAAPRDVERAFQEAQLRLSAGLQPVLGVDRTLYLLAAGIADTAGPGAFGALIGLLEEIREIAGTPPVPTGAVLQGRAPAGPPAREALEAVRRLHDAGKLRPVMVFGRPRADVAPAAEGDPGWTDTLAGAVDALDRLARLQPLAGDLDAERLVGAWAHEGVSSVGLAWTGDTDAGALEEAIRRVFDAGWLAPGLAPSRGRVGVMTAVIGSDAGQVASLSRLESAMGVAREILPQVRLATGIYEDDGEGVRIVAWIGGLPFPEDLVLR